MSSVSALKARPQMAIALPERSAPRYRFTLSSTTSFWHSFTASTDLSTSRDSPRSSAVRMIAFTSLGKQLPAVAGAGIEERAADPLVGTDAEADVVHVGPDQ